MEWRHYDVRKSGTTLVEDSGVPIHVGFEMGIITTGRSRVFYGDFVRVRLPSGQEFLGQDTLSVLGALFDLASHLSEIGLELQCVGRDLRFQESGLSQNSGYGYLPGHDAALHMMEAPFLEEAAIDDGVDRLIFEAVRAMRIGV